MSDTVGQQTSPNPRNPWVIGLVVFFLSCGLCMGVCGLLIAFVPDVLRELGINLTPANLLFLR